MRAEQIRRGADPIAWPALLHPLRAALRKVAITLQLWRRRRRDRLEVARLDERTLRDIGLTRGDAEFLTNKPFWRA
jgi:uncharacterized protein YjiS (DUF1127 family)